MSLGEPVEVWFTPRGTDNEPCLSIAYDGGPKRYMRIWLDSPYQTPEWGWSLHETAVKLWERDDDNPAW